jgi:shikimate kinase
MSKQIDYNIFLIGFMGAGKSTIARALQRELDFPLIEMDERIVEEQGMSINDIFEKYGEERFRDIESELVKTIAAEEPSIVSCGGGVVVRPGNRRKMKESGRIVLLTATPETVYERVKNSDDRPILNGNMNVDYIAGLMEKRRALYEEAADITVATDGKTRTDIVQEILDRLEEYVHEV